MLYFMVTVWPRKKIASYMERLALKGSCLNISKHFILGANEMTYLSVLLCAVLWSHKSYDMLL